MIIEETQLWQQQFEDYEWNDLDDGKNTHVD